MFRLLHTNARLLAALFLGALVIALVVAFNGLGRSSGGQMVQAFLSPIQTPTSPPYPSPPTPEPTPTPPAVCPPQIRWHAFEANVEVEGLPGAERAMLRVHPIREDITACLAARGITLPEMAFGNGRHRLRLQEIPDGAYYKLEVQAPPSYFRDPAGYLFQVQDGQIVHRPGFAFRFRLVPSTEQDLPPCPQFHIRSNSSNLVPDVIRVVCKAEPLIDISAPSRFALSNPVGLKKNRPQVADADYIYRYVGVGATQDNQGVWGRRYVVDPSVEHSLWPWQKQFVVEYSYARGPAPDRHWMEAGWAEVSWRDDQQYVYQYDSNTREWHFFDQFALTLGSPVETLVEYRPDKNTWWALLYLHDNQWALLAEENLGFVLADDSYNWGEIYRSESTMSPPILPPSKFDKGYLKINEAWRVWDISYATFVNEEFPYQCDIIDRYTHFRIHSPISFLSFVLKNQ